MHKQFQHKGRLVKYAKPAFFLFIALNCIAFMQFNQVGNIGKENKSTYNFNT